MDDTQYENRLRNWDFDMIIASWGAVAVAGQRAARYWGSQAADSRARATIVGIKNPAVDALIERVIFAKDRDELVAATKALDRVLLWNHYVVPQLTYGCPHARWDRFGRPDTLPKYAPGFPDIWWWDEREGGQAGTRSVTRLSGVSRRDALALGAGAARVRPCAGTAWAHGAGAERTACRRSAT